MKQIHELLAVPKGEVPPGQPEQTPEEAVMEAPQQLEAPVGCFVTGIHYKVVPQFVS